MYYCKVHEFVVRKESVLLESGASIISERIFIYTKVRDFEKYNDDTEIASTVIIVRGVDQDYLNLMTSEPEKCIGGVYKISSYDDEMYVFDIFVADNEFDAVCEVLNTTGTHDHCNLQIYVHLHEYNDFDADVVLPITSLSISPENADCAGILISANS